MSCFHLIQNRSGKHTCVHHVASCGRSWPPVATRDPTWPLMAPRGFAVLERWSTENSFLMILNMYTPKLPIDPNMGQLLVFALWLNPLLVYPTFVATRMYAKTSPPSNLINFPFPASIVWPSTYLKKDKYLYRSLLSVVAAEGRRSYTQVFWNSSQKYLAKW